MKLEPQHRAKVCLSRYYLVLGDFLEVSISSGSDILKSSFNLEVYGSDGRIVAIYIPNVHAKVADVVTACQ